MTTYCVRCFQGVSDEVREQTQKEHPDQHVAVKVLVVPGAKTERRPLCEDHLEAMTGALTQQNIAFTVEPIGNKWDDFLQTMQGRTDEEGVFNDVKKYVETSGFRMESPGVCSEVFARALGILHNEDFNHWSQATYRWCELHPPVFEFLQYHDGHAFRAIEAIQEVYRPEQDFAKIVADVLAEKGAREGIHGVLGMGQSDMMFSWKGRRYAISVRDCTYDTCFQRIEALEEHIRLNPEWDQMEKGKKKLEAYKEQLATLKERP